MIRYALACEAGHGFESWFRSSDDFDAQVARGLVACPACGSLTVAKQVMAPQVARTDKDEAAPPLPVLVSPEEQALRQRIAELHQHLKAHSEDVGQRLAEEARKIHYGDSDARTIHGQASLDDARALVEEGVPFLPLPALPDERN